MGKKIIKLEDEFIKTFFSKRINKVYTFMEFLKTTLENLEVKRIVIHKNVKNQDLINFFIKSLSWKKDILKF